MEPHMQHYEFTASSSLSKDQLEVFALYQMLGLNISNDKFQVILAINNQHLMLFKLGCFIEGSLEIGFFERAHFVHS